MVENSRMKSAYQQSGAWIRRLVLLAGLLVGLLIGGVVSPAGAQTDTTSSGPTVGPIETEIEADDEVDAQRREIDTIGSGLVDQPWYVAPGAAEDPAVIAELQARLTTASGQVWGIVALDSVPEIGTVSFASEVLGKARSSSSDVRTLIVLTPVDFNGASREYGEVELQAALTSAQDALNADVVTGIEAVFIELTGIEPPPPVEAAKPNNIARYLAIGAVLVAAVVVGVALFRRRPPGEPPAAPGSSNGPRLVGQQHSPR